jgi:hypothetical protein
MRPNGKYTEIDLVSVDNSSIIVYESKNYSGWIFGRQSNPYWTQSFRTKKVKFYNPIMQNNTHINALKNYLSDFPLNYYSIIVFGKRCLLINLEYDLANTHVITRNKLKRTVKNILNSSHPSINDSQLKEVIERLSKTQKPDDNIVNKHLIDINTCPWCGAELVERTAYSSGYKFIGCKGFPKCKYTRKF